MPINKTTDIDDREALNIAAAMREVSEVDGIHPSESALIDAFEAGIAGDPVKHADLGLFNTPELKEVFLRSVILVALADGKLSPEEMVLLQGYARRVEVEDSRLGELIVEMGKELLASFKGVKTFRSDVEAIGRELGLGEQDISDVLDEE